MKALRFTLPALFALIGAPAAQAFNCYIPKTDHSPAALHEKPDVKSRVIARMPPGGMIKQVGRFEPRNGWVRVKWSPAPEEKAKPRTGWVVHDHVYGGECED